MVAHNEHDRVGRVDGVDDLAEAGVGGAGAGARVVAIGAVDMGERVGLVEMEHGEVEPALDGGDGARHDLAVGDVVVSVA